MIRPPRTVTLDARPRSAGGGLLALEVVRGHTVIGHLARAAEQAGATVLEVVAEPSEAQAVKRAIETEGRGGLRIVSSPGDAGTLTMLADRLYDGRKLRRALRRGGDAEAAVLWRLDSPELLAAVEVELLRRAAYQPLGRHWALEPARAMARALAPTGLHPNALTLAAGLLMAAAAMLEATGAAGWSGRLAIAAAMAIALVLDTADGHLARLQGRSSALGKWLDATLDEAADMLLHGAIAWAAFTATGRPEWLVLGMVYGMGKYVFFASNTIWEEAHPRENGTGGSDPVAAMAASPLRRAAHYLGHADVRWHAWIMLGAVGLLRYELAVFAGYFVIRAVAGAVRKSRGLSHA